MVSKIYSATLKGLSSQIIEVEVAATKGLRAFNIVGLADTAIKEAKERVGSAIKSIGFSSPQHQAKRVLVNLAPADLKKEGTLYDLPIALGFLLASEQARFNPERKIILGELSLDGRLKPIKGALLFALLAKEKGFSEIILPKENTKEASLVNWLSQERPLKIIGESNLKEVINVLEGKKAHQLPLATNEGLPELISDFEIDFDWIKGQAHAKRALEIAAAGGHNVLLQGPPGTGKTILAKAIVSILPQLVPEEILELTKIYSASGLLSEERPFLSERPFRAPHHSSSEVAILGGGNPPRVGEITLSHRGVLFMDEFPEFHRNVLESLRQPLEQGEITIQRARYALTLPARFTLIAAANPCPCGYYNDPERECVCTPSQIASYRRKLSGPLMDRFDISAWVGKVRYEDLTALDKAGESSQTRERIKRARDVQRERLKPDGILLNSEIEGPQIKKYCEIPSEAHSILKKFVDGGKLSARGYCRVLKVARTIADLEARENISFQDVAEALSYRLRNGND